ETHCDAALASGPGKDEEGELEHCLVIVRSLFVKHAAAARAGGLGRAAFGFELGSKLRQPVWGVDLDDHGHRLSPLFLTRYGAVSPKRRDVAGETVVRLPAAHVRRRHGGATRPRTTAPAASH